MVARCAVIGSLQTYAKWLQVQQGKESKHIKHRKAPSKPDVLTSLALLDLQSLIRLLR